MHKSTDLSGVGATRVVLRPVATPLPLGFAALTVATHTKLVPAAVITVSALRFAVTGIAEIDGGRGWLQAAGWLGVALALLSLYAAHALELEGSESRTVLPLGRWRGARAALQGPLEEQAATVATEPGYADNCDHRGGQTRGREEDAWTRTGPGRRRR